MGENRTPGPMCEYTPWDAPVEDGTNVRAPSPPPGPACNAQVTTDWELEQALDELEAEGESFAFRFIDVAIIRQRYVQSVQAMAREILEKVHSGEMTSKAGAELAHGLRNEIMDNLRRESMDLGRSMAEKLKAVGKTLEEILQKIARKKFGKDFTLLTEAERGEVYLECIASAGRPNPEVVKSAARYGKLGKGLFVLSLAIAVYNVATADDKWKAAGHESAGLGGGLLGGAAGGAAFGLICGPGAPVCVTIGIFVGGALGALGTDYAFEWAWRWK